MIGSKNFEIGANEFLAGVTSGAGTNDGGFQMKHDKLILPLFQVYYMLLVIILIKAQT